MKTTKLIVIIALIFNMLGCSSKRGFYDADDPNHDEFSMFYTLFLVVAIAGTVYGVYDANKSGGSSSSNSGYAWDRQSNNTWVCRNKSNGQYSEYHYCNGIAKVDYWPN